MSYSDPIPTDDLLDVLRAWARGMYTTQAMVEILARGSGNWLNRHDFRTACIGIDPDEAGFWAWIDYDAARAFLDTNPIASGGERRMLELALSFGAGHHVDLGETLCGIDDHNRTVILDAVAHCGGWHERQLTGTVDGTWTNPTPTDPRIQALHDALDQTTDHGPNGGFDDGGGS